MNATILTDEWGHELGYCNSCGEEVEMDTECCEDGEVEPIYVEQADSDLPGMWEPSDLYGGWADTDGQPRDGRTPHP